MKLRPTAHPSEIGALVLTPSDQLARIIAVGTGADGEPAVTCLYADPPAGDALTWPVFMLRVAPPFLTAPQQSGPNDGVQVIVDGRG